MAKPKHRQESAILRKAIEKHKRAAYREAILAAASAVFSRLSLGDVKMSDIAAEAGVSVGTLYNYFENKESVINSLTLHEHSEYRSRVALAESENDPLERIRKILEISFRFVQERGALLAMALQAGLYGRHCISEQFDEIDYQTHLFVRKLYEEAFAQAATQGKVRKDISPDNLARVLEGMVSSVVFEWIRSGRIQILTDQSAFVFDLFMKGAVVR